ncbi:MAG: hypothetical protein IJ760_04180 [Bacteroidales bacterium]|nr:hypothetical protein [Bacteroidales bacterium]
MDEAHHALDKIYRVLWDGWPKAKFLGLTSTPCRVGGAEFVHFLDVLLQSWTILDFIDKGWLSDFEYLQTASDAASTLTEKNDVDGGVLDEGPGYGDGYAVEYRTSN